MEINKYIDHTNLKATATKSDIEKLCQEAINNKLEAVCVNPYYVSYAKELLKNSNVLVCTVVGFPLGMNTTRTKEYEAIIAIEDGADEIDMVINIGALKEKNYDYVKQEIEDIRNAIDGKTLKVIIETCYLTSDEIIKMTEICNETYANFIKTSTGFGSSGAKLEDIELINKYKNEVLEIKASGGIKDYNQAINLIKAGATRIGTSSGVEIVNYKED
ncbi:MAG: deoxyribose-phosphate aldolase [Bacilli bacterium]|nr:deoxyribose-phosphate aldolase [Bacilli bacterium]